MGVPKFFRWLSERYPKINQRFGSPPNPETHERYFGRVSSEDDNDDEASSSLTGGVVVPFDAPDPLSTCGLAPPIDRLYVDMNGIIHGCSHNNSGEEDEQQRSSSGSNSGEATHPSSSSHSSSSGPTRKEIYRNVCYYLDRIVSDIAQPTELVYLAIDGVAPRAKLNQQRSRRYRNSTHGEIETNLYEAHAKAQEARIDDDEEDDDDGVRRFDAASDRREAAFSTPFAMDDGFSYLFQSDDEPHRTTRQPSPGTSVAGTTTTESDPALPPPPGTAGTTAEDPLKEIAPGRFTGKFQAGQAAGATKTGPDAPFHSNVITPGTEFFQDFVRHLEHFLQHKISTDPKWQNLTIILSGPNVPGEGEHKIMDFIRQEKKRPDYDPNLRHCIMGQDGDLIMLGLATHEPNLVLLRERVVFNMTKRKFLDAKYSSSSSSSSSDNNHNHSNTGGSLGAYLHNAHFEFLHMGVLRDYLAFEFETSNVLSSSPYDLEHTIDDFVLMTFLVGNDFLPHMPALDIADHAFDLLFYTYKKCRKDWLKFVTKHQRRAGPEDDAGGPSHLTLPYLTHGGNILSGRRLETFLTAVGGHEVDYYDKKKSSADSEHKRLRKNYKKWGMDAGSLLPDADLVASKEASDRAAYRDMMLRKKQQSPLPPHESSLEGELVEGPAAGTEPTRGASRDLHGGLPERDTTHPASSSFSPVMTGDFQPVEEELEEGLISRMSNLLQNSLSKASENDSSNTKWNTTGMDDQDLKGRYYYDKFQFTPFDEEKHVALRKAYVEGLVWNLKYYYEGCVSWDWYFPYHYGPMLSDLVNLDEILEEIDFSDTKGAPLRPFEQLMGCMPPSQSNHLPEPYRWLMTDPDSPIIDFYPRHFTIDMNGKRWPWEAVTLLPFIDSNRLLQAAATVDESGLTEEEKSRNTAGETMVFRYDPSLSETLDGIGDTEGFQTVPQNKTSIVPFSTSTINFVPTSAPVLSPELTPGVEFPLAGYGSLRDASVQSVWRRRIGVDVFSSRSRYRTSCLEMRNLLPPLPPTENLATKLIGSIVFINYPYFLEALVTAVSDEKKTVRGREGVRPWTKREAEVWRTRRDGAIRQFLTGEGVSGTGGVIIPEEQPVTLSVRPLESIVKSKQGENVKSYAKFELEVPLMSTLWTPSQADPRLDIPSRLEKNAFNVAAPKLEDGIPKSATRSLRSKKRLFPPKNSSVRIQSAQFSNATRNNYQRREFSFASALPLTHNYGSMGRTIPKTDYLGIACNRPVAVPRRKHFPERATIRTRVGIRGGKLLAAGAMAACLLFQSTTNANLPPYASNVRTCTTQSPEICTTLPGWSSRFFDLRGGQSESDFNDETTTPALEFAHGTTTLSFVFQGGIVAAVDSRASMGSFVGSKTTQKVLPVNSHILGTMAGGAADCMYWIRSLKSRAMLHELTEGSRMSVARASRLISNDLFNQRGRELSVGTMIMGFDEAGPARIFYIDDSGKRIEGGMFAVGSGSTFALGILDTEFRHDLTEEDAISLGIRAIRHATFRDAFSGGFINVYLIKRDGWKKVYSEDIARLSSEILDQKE